MLIRTQLSLALRLNLHQRLLRVFLVPLLRSLLLGCPLQQGNLLCLSQLRRPLLHLHLLPLLLHLCSNVQRRLPSMLLLRTHMLCLLRLLGDKALLLLVLGMLLLLHGVYKALLLHN